MTRDRLVRAEAEVQRASDRATTVTELCQGVQAAISAVVPADRWCGFAVDPFTLFATDGYHDEGVDGALMPRLLELEYGEADSTHVAELARSRTGVATLTEATGGDPALSARWRDVLEPSGVAHELRAVFRDGRTVWGALVLMRGGDVVDFSRDEVDFVGRVAPRVAGGFRRVLVRQHLDHGDDVRESGIVLLRGSPPAVSSATAAGRAWLDELADGTGDHPPTAVLSAARAAHGSSAPAVVRARTRRGRWLTITAELTDGESGERDVGLVLQPSRPAEIAQIVGAAHGLTARETDVVLLVASGNTNTEIARRLGLSRYTVADHLKSVFAKLGVVTRGQLTSMLFYDYYLPRLAAGDPAGVDGWFLPQPLPTPARTS